MVTFLSPCYLPLVASLTDTPGASPPSIVQVLQDYALLRPYNSSPPFDTGRRTDKQIGVGTR